MTRDQGQDPLAMGSSSATRLRTQGSPNRLDVFPRDKLNIWLERSIPWISVFAGPAILLDGLLGEHEHGLLMAVFGGLLFLLSSYFVRYIRPYEEIQIDQAHITFLPQQHSLPLSEIQGLTGPSWLDRDDAHRANEITLTMASERREWFVGIYRWKGHTCKVSVAGTDARGILMTISSRTGKAPFFV